MQRLRPGEEHGLGGQERGKCRVIAGGHGLCKRPLRVSHLSLQFRDIRTPRAHGATCEERHASGGDGEKQLIGGLYYRLGDAIVPMIGFELKNVRFTFSYDVTTSSLHNFNGYRGASEFNILKKGFYNEYKGNRRETMCPSF